MKKILFIMVFCIWVQIFSQADIVGGEDCEITDYPWQAAIEISSSNGWYYSCGASIINQYWVLTAAHCVEENNQIANADDITVRVGTTYSSGGDSYQVAQVISHPSYYGGASNGNDIALLRISGSIDFNENVQPIALICQEQVTAGAQSPGSIATVTGWGNTTQGGQGSDILQFIEVPIVAYNASGLSWGLNVDQNTEILAGLIEGGMDSCQGDSGGPLAVRNIENTGWLLAGITSWGLGCAQQGRPGVYTKVSNYIDWINQNTNGCIDPDVSAACTNSNQNVGCTDVFACNYDPDAEINSCCIYITDDLYDCDGDQLNNGEDNCPVTVNFSQSDSDNDGVGNACDNCPTTYNPDQINSDWDPQGDACDPYIDIIESLQKDNTIIRKLDVYGREIHQHNDSQVAILIYSNGDVKKLFK